MKKKGLSLFFIGLLSLSLTGCDGNQISKEKAMEKLEKAQEVVEEAKGYEFSTTNNANVEMNIGIGSTQISTTTAVNTDAKLGILFNNKEHEQFDRFYGTIDLGLDMNVLGQSFNAKSDSKMYGVNNTLYTVSTTGNDSNSVKTKASLNLSSIITYAQSMELEGINSSLELDLKKCVNDLSTKYGDVEYRQSFSKISFIYHIDNAKAKAMLTASLAESEELSNDSSSDQYLAALLAKLEVNDSYVKFTFNEKATILQLEVNLDASADASVGSGSYSLASSLKFKVNSKTNISIVDSFKNISFPSESELNSWN